jgi:hypothetical protein
MLGHVERLFDMAEEWYDMPSEEMQQNALRPGTAFW